MKRHLIFDWDGPAADTCGLCFELLQEHFPDLTRELFDDHHDGNVYRSVSRLTDEQQVHFFAEYGRRLNQRHVRDSRAHFFELGRTHRMSIVSSNCEAAIAVLLEEVGLRACFPDILGKEFHRSKVDKLLYLLRRYTLHPCDTVFITDTLGDLHEADDVNIPTIAVTWGVHTRERLMRGNPHHIVDSWDELRRVIASL